MFLIQSTGNKAELFKQGRIIGIQKVRRQTLRGKIKFRKLFESGKWLNSRHIKLIYYKSAAEESAQAQIAVCVSKSEGNAVKRNRLRRIIRELLDEYADSLMPGYYIGIIPKKTLSELPSTEQKSQLRKLLARSGLLQTEKEQG